METIVEEDEENYLAILSDCADHCVTRKVTAPNIRVVYQTLRAALPPNNMFWMR